MPIHDWTRVDANLFHDFHQTWTIGIRNTLNGGLLPRGFFALMEQHAAGVNENRRANAPPSCPEDMREAVEKGLEAEGEA